MRILEDLYAVQNQIGPCPTANGYVVFAPLHTETYANSEAPSRTRGGFAKGGKQALGFRREADVPPPTHSRPSKLPRSDTSTAYELHSAAKISLPV